jgi:hypothetical protein
MRDELAHLVQAWPNVTRCRAVLEMLKEGDIENVISQLGPVQFDSHVAKAFRNRSVMLT